MGRYINHNDSKTVNYYFKDLRQQSTLTKDEEFELALRIKKGDQKAINELASANLKFVVSIAKEYQGNGLPLSDLISEVNYGMIKAAQKFDANRGFKFISYAVWWIRQAIIQALNEHSRTVRLPANVINKITTTKRFLEAFEHANEREPVFGEIIGEDGSKLDIEVESGYCTSLNERDWDGEGEELGDLLVDIDNLESDDKYEVDIKLKAKLEETLSTLTSRERDIIKCYYGIDTECEPMTLEAIGDKYDLTKERVRQIKSKSLIKLRANTQYLFKVMDN